MDSAISVREFVNKLASSAMMFGPRVDPCHHAGSTPIYRSVSTPSSLVKPFLYDYTSPPPPPSWRGNRPAISFLLA